MRRLREVGVTPQPDLAEAGPATEPDRAIQILGGALMAGTISRTIHDEQRLARVGQRHEQGVVAPLSLVITPSNPQQSREFSSFFAFQLLQPAPC